MISFRKISGLSDFLDKEKNEIKVNFVIYKHPTFSVKFVRPHGGFYNMEIPSFDTAEEAMDEAKRIMLDTFSGHEIVDIHKKDSSEGYNDLFDLYGEFGAKLR